MFKSDIEIARDVKLQPITTIAKKIGIDEECLEPFGKFKAKINVKDIQPKGKVILVTAINPTSLGEGKTTVSIGLADGMSRIGKKVCLALREPSLGPVFGVKGGATGGGQSQVAPMDDINLHFNGDFHAITSANNLLSALIDNHIHQGNELKIDTRRILWRRCMDMNDRALRNTVVGLGGATAGVPREDGFDITAASEVMAVLCLAKDINDLKQRLGEIIVAYNLSGQPVRAKELKAQEAMTILLKDAIKPNLVQTLEGTPAILHGGPFANIAHGCNSIIATKTAQTYADYVVTEAGFGADLGAEKFLDIKCRIGDIVPSCVVLVATVRALKFNGGANKDSLQGENMVELEKGIANLGGHIDNLNKVFGVNVVVAINKFYTDTDKEIQYLKDYCKEHNAVACVSEAWEFGGKGAEALANTVVEACKKEAKLNYCYELTDSITDKINKVATKIYGAGKVIFTDKAKKEIDILTQMGCDNLPICIAKTQYSFSDNASLLSRPTGFDFTVRDCKLRGGAGFIIVLSGDIMLMPGLPKVPNANKMTIDKDCIIEGLF